MMSEAFLLSTHSYTPSSPDPTHLRLLAFSVAEAALQSDLNSPSVSLTTDKAAVLPELSHHLCDWPVQVGDVEEDWLEDLWCDTKHENRSQWEMDQKERRMKKCESCKSSYWYLERRMADGPALAALGKILPESLSISPSYHSLSLRRNSSLAATASDCVWDSLYERPKIASGKPTKEIKRQRCWSCTHFADPRSPLSTSSQLNQPHAPPDFETPLAAKKCSSHPEHGPVYKKHASMKSDVFHPSQPIDYSPCTNVRLPSLAQIHAKMGSPARQQSASGMGAVRMDSSESIEILQTPTEEYTSSRIEARLALSTVLHRRPSTPSSPVTMPAVSSPKEKEVPRLAPFLRERTNGRISGRPSSMPPMTFPAEHMASLATHGKGHYTPPKPAMTATPPKNRYNFEGRGDVPEPIRPPLIQSMSGSTATSRIGGPSFPHRITTPSTERTTVSPTYITSPTGSASSTMSIPRITCTPAPVKVVKDGLEMDSDEEEDDVVLFEADMCGSEPGKPSWLQAAQEKERVTRAAAMKKRLLQRRMSN